MNPLDFLFGDGIKRAANYGLKQLFGNNAVQIPSRSSGNSSSSVRKSSSGAIKPIPMGYERSMDEYLAEVARLMGMGFDEGTARAMAGGGGGGYGGGGGGGGVYIDTAARDAALANAASTYASAAATFNASPEEYKKISAEEKSSGDDGAKNATTGLEQAYKAALASRAAERAALGIEDAAKVSLDTVENERQVAAKNIEQDSSRRNTRVQGHLDNALKFNTDLKAVVELEGKEKQKEIADYYANQLAQIAARSGGGRGGGGYRRGGGGGGSRSMTPGQLWNAARDLQSDDLRRLNAMYTPGYNQRALKNVGVQYPNASLSQQLSLSKYLYPNQYSRP